VIPTDIVDVFVEEAPATTFYDEFCDEEAARGRSLIGLFLGVNDDAKRDFEVWKRARGHA
jgi:hypothetical protein